jgi:hypothetical protein
VSPASANAQLAVAYAAFATGQTNTPRSNREAGWVAMPLQQAMVGGAFRVPIIRGRDFSFADDASAPGVVIINDAMARRYWPNGDPLRDGLIIGRGMRPAYDLEPVRQIVGIVGNVRDTGLRDNPRPAMYVPVAQEPDGVTVANVKLLHSGLDCSNERRAAHGWVAERVTVSRQLQRSTPSVERLDPSSI